MEGGFKNSLNGIALFLLLERLFTFLKSSSIIVFISFFASSSSLVILVWLNSSGKTFSNLVYVGIMFWILDFTCMVATYTSCFIYIQIIHHLKEIFIFCK